MPVILLRPKTINTKSDEQPNCCPYCGSDKFQPWGEVTRPVGNGQAVHVKTFRYRCEACHRTFRHVPQGDDQSNECRGTQQLAALIWALGYSYRDVVSLFTQLGVSLSRSTVWREGQALAARLDGIEFRSQSGIFTIDQKYIHRARSNFGIMVAVDLGNGRFAILGSLNGQNPRAIQAWLKSLLKDTDVHILKQGTDRLDRFVESKRLSTGPLMA